MAHDAADEARSIPTNPPPRAGVILIVEDDDAVRALERRVLERAGYTVLQALNGRSALALAAEHQGSIDLVLSDTVMPEMGGFELERNLRQLYPELRVILTSGHPEVGPPSQPEGVSFLGKPFTVQGLLEVVANALAAD